MVRVMVSLLPALTCILAAPGDFDVVVNEIHYHPFGNDPGDEFVELLTRGALQVDLSGWRLDGGLVFSFPPGTLIQGGSFLVLSPDPARTARRYGLERAIVAGPWAGHLDNDGDALELSDAAGR